MVAVFATLAERLVDEKAVDVSSIVLGVASGEFETRTALLQVCALFPGDPIRGAFRSALQDPDERIRRVAARALCHTGDAGLLPDLLIVARQTSDSGLRSLAIESVVHLTADDAASLSIPQRTETLAAVFKLATSVKDKRQVLSGLARVPNATTLKLAEQAATDPAVKAEAEAARLQITEQVGFAAPFIQDWLVCGPYRKAGAAGAMAVFDMPFGPEKPGETVPWHSVPHGDGVNLAALFPGEESCAAYLKAELTAPAPCDAILLLGSDDGVKVWLNGKVVHTNNVDRGEVVDQDKAPIRLAKGATELLLKVTQGGGGWSVRARIVGADGQPIAGLRVTPSAGALPVKVPTPQPPPVPKAATLPGRDTFQKLRLADQFYAEGAYFGDLNRDGKLDIVAGPFWFEGPDFTKRHDYRPAAAFDPNPDNSQTSGGAPTWSRLGSFPTSKAGSQPALRSVANPRWV